MARERLLASGMVAWITIFTCSNNNHPTRTRSAKSIHHDQFAKDDAQASPDK
jgi:hypothetical protein